MDNSEIMELDGEDHIIGDAECVQCGWEGYPHLHEDCGGLMHGVFGDEDSDCSFFLFTKCDKCGESE